MFFDSNNRMKEDEEFDTLKSNDYDYKLKSNFDSENKYDVFAPNPK